MTINMKLAEAFQSYEIKRNYLHSEMNSMIFTRNLIHSNEQTII